MWPEAIELFLYYAVSSKVGGKACPDLELNGLIIMKSKRLAQTNMVAPSTITTTMKCKSI